MTERTYNWNGNENMPIAFPQWSDEEMAGRVRMLMRDQLNHEVICTAARDRIMCLSKEKRLLENQIRRLETKIETAHAALT